ncbi:MAG: iron chaperone [Bacilli bacterium]
MNEHKDIKAYINSFPPQTQVALDELYSLIKQLVPQASEKMSYQMPTFFLYGNLVHFAAYKDYIGIYPSPSAISAFKDLLLDFKTSKGSIHIPLNRPLPKALIEKIVSFRVNENTQKHQNKTHKSD